MASSLGKVALPLPPSANRYWRTFRGRTVRSAEANSWLELAAQAIRRNILATTLPVHVRIGIRNGKGFRINSDIDNYVKVTLDALVPEKRHAETDQITKHGAGIVPDDSAQYVQCIEVSLLPEIKQSKTMRGEAEVIVEVFRLEG